MGLSELEIWRDTPDSGSLRGPVAIGSNGNFLSLDNSI